MEPAKSIIAKCGGISTVARWLGLNHSTVLRWTYPRKDGGTDGVIPAKHQIPLVGSAKKAGVRIAPSEFFAANDTPSQERAA